MNEQVRMYVDELISSSTAGSVLVTWVNHYSVFVSFETDREMLNQFDYVGIDGLLLSKLLKGIPRTSADLVLGPLLATGKFRRIMLMGGAPDVLERSILKLRNSHDGLLFSGMDGYDGLLRGADLREAIAQFQPDLVLVGLGPGLQDEVAIEVNQWVGRGVVMTCGGLLDQLAIDNYYPSWAYVLRVNWLIRLLREPMRLWRRYTLDAVFAVRNRKKLLIQMSQIRGVSSYRSVVRG